MKISKETKVGFLCTAVLVIAYWGFNFLKGREIFSSKNVYCTVYESGQGLTTSSPVLVNGMSVGRVRSMQILPDKKHSVLVTFETERSIRLTDATQARLINQNLLGSKGIDLLIEEGNPLKNYDTVSGHIEKSLGETFVESALPTLNDAKDISLLASQFVSNLVENTDKINAIFTNLEQTVRQLRETVDVNQKGINALGQNMTEVSSALSDRENGVRPLLAKLNLLLEGVKGKDIQEILVKLKGVSSNVENVLDKTTQGENSLSKLLYDDSLYTNLDQTLLSLNHLLVDMKAHPWRYVSFSIFGKNRHYEKSEEE